MARTSSSEAQHLRSRWEDRELCCASTANSEIATTKFQSTFKLPASVVWKAEPCVGRPLCSHSGLKNSRRRRNSEILSFVLISALWWLRDVSPWKKKPEMEIRTEKAVFKNPFGGFGTETHMNNTSKIPQRKPGWLYGCQILARSLICSDDRTGWAPCRRGKPLPQQHPPCVVQRFKSYMGESRLAESAETGCVWKHDCFRKPEFVRGSASYLLCNASHCWKKITTGD